MMVARPARPSRRRRGGGEQPQPQQQRQQQRQQRPPAPPLVTVLAAAAAAATAAAAFALTIAFVGISAAAQPLLAPIAYVRVAPPNFARAASGLRSTALGAGDALGPDAYVLGRGVAANWDAPLLLNASVPGSSAASLGDGRGSGWARAVAFATQNFSAEGVSGNNPFRDWAELVDFGSLGAAGVAFGLQASPTIRALTYPAFPGGRVLSLSPAAAAKLGGRGRIAAGAAGPSQLFVSSSGCVGFDPEASLAEFEDIYGNNYAAPVGTGRGQQGAPVRGMCFQANPLVSLPGLRTAMLTRAEAAPARTGLAADGLVWVADWLGFTFFGTGSHFQLKYFFEDESLELHFAEDSDTSERTFIGTNEGDSDEPVGWNLLNYNSRRPERLADAYPAGTVLRFTRDAIDNTATTGLDAVSLGAVRAVATINDDAFPYGDDMVRVRVDVIASAALATDLGPIDVHIRFLDLPGQPTFSAPVTIRSNAAGMRAAVATIDAPVRAALRAAAFDVNHTMPLPERNGGSGDVGGGAYAIQAWVGGAASDTVAQVNNRSIAHSRTVYSIFMDALAPRVLTSTSSFTDTLTVHQMTPATAPATYIAEKSYVSLDQVLTNEWAADHGVRLSDRVTEAGSALVLGRRQIGGGDDQMLLVRERNVPANGTGALGITLTFDTAAIAADLQRGDVAIPDYFARVLSLRLHRRQQQWEMDAEAATNGNHFNKVWMRSALDATTLLAQPWTEVYDHGARFREVAPAEDSIDVLLPLTNASLISNLTQVLIGEEGTAAKTDLELEKVRVLGPNGQLPVPVSSFVTTPDAEGIHHYGYGDARDAGFRATQPGDVVNVTFSLTSPVGGLDTRLTLVVRNITGDLCVGGDCSAAAAALVGREIDLLVPSGQTMTYDFDGLALDSRLTWAVGGAYRWFRIEYDIVDRFPAFLPRNTSAPPVPFLSYDRTLTILYPAQMTPGGAGAGAPPYAASGYVETFDNALPGELTGDNSRTPWDLETAPQLEMDSDNTFGRTAIVNGTGLGADGSLRSLELSSVLASGIQSRPRIRLYLNMSQFRAARDTLHLSFDLFCDPVCTPFTTDDRRIIIKSRVDAPDRIIYRYGPDAAAAAGQWHAVNSTTIDLSRAVREIGQEFGDTARIVIWGQESALGQLSRIDNVRIFHVQAHNVAVTGIFPSGQAVGAHRFLYSADPQVRVRVSNRGMPMTNGGGVTGEVRLVIDAGAGPVAHTRDLPLDFELGEAMVLFDGVTPNLAAGANATIMSATVSLTGAVDFDPSDDVFNTTFTPPAELGILPGTTQVLFRPQTFSSTTGAVTETTYDRSAANRAGMDFVNDPELPLNPGLQGREESTSSGRLRLSPRFRDTLVAGRRTAEARWWLNVGEPFGRIRVDDLNLADCHIGLIVELISYNRQPWVVPEPAAAAQMPNPAYDGDNQLVLGVVNVSSTHGPHVRANLWSWGAAVRNITRQELEGNGYTGYANPTVASVGVNGIDLCAALRAPPFNMASGPFPQGAYVAFRHSTDGNDRVEFDNVYLSPETMDVAGDAVEVVPPSESGRRLPRTGARRSGSAQLRSRTRRVSRISVPAGSHYVAAQTRRAGGGGGVWTERQTKFVDQGIPSVGGVVAGSYTESVYFPDGNDFRPHLEARARAQGWDQGYRRQVGDWDASNDVGPTYQLTVRPHDPLPLPARFFGVPASSSLPTTRVTDSTLEGLLGAGGAEPAWEFDRVTGSGSEAEYAPTGGGVAGGQSSRATLRATAPSPPPPPPPPLPPSSPSSEVCYQARFDGSDVALVWAMPGQASVRSELLDDYTGFAGIAYRLVDGQSSYFRSMRRVGTGAIVVTRSAEAVVPAMFRVWSGGSTYYDAVEVSVEAATAPNASVAATLPGSAWTLLYQGPSGIEGPIGRASPGRWVNVSNPSSAQFNVFRMIVLETRRTYSRYVEFGDLEILTACEAAPTPAASLSTLVLAEPSLVLYHTFDSGLASAGGSYGTTRTAVLQESANLTAPASGSPMVGTGAARDNYVALGNEPFLQLMQPGGKATFEFVFVYEGQDVPNTGGGPGRSPLNVREAAHPGHVPFSLHVYANRIDLYRNPNGNQGFGTGSNVIVRDRLYHVALVWDYGNSQVADLYLDGVRLGGTQCAPGTQVINANQTLSASGYKGAGGEAWVGIVDEVAVYDELLSDKTIAEHAITALATASQQPVVTTGALTTTGGGSGSGGTTTTGMGSGSSTTGSILPAPISSQGALRLFANLEHVPAALASFPDGDNELCLSFDWAPEGTADDDSTPDRDVLQVRSSRDTWYTIYDFRTSIAPRPAAGTWTHVECLNVSTVLAGASQLINEDFELRFLQSATDAEAAASNGNGYSISNVDLHFAYVTTTGTTATTASPTTAAASSTAGGATATTGGGGSGGVTPPSPPTPPSSDGVGDGNEDGGSSELSGVGLVFLIVAIVLFVVAAAFLAGAAYLEFGRKGGDGDAYSDAESMSTQDDSLSSSE